MQRTETFTVEASRKRSKIGDNNRWTTEVNPPIQLKRGDRISVSNSIISTDNAGSSTTMELSFDPIPESGLMPSVAVFEVGFYVNDNSQNTISMPLYRPVNPGKAVFHAYLKSAKNDGGTIIGNFNNPAANVDIVISTPAGDPGLNLNSFSDKKLTPGQWQEYIDKNVQSINTANEGWGSLQVPPDVYNPHQRDVPAQNHDVKINCIIVISGYDLTGTTYNTQALLVDVGLPAPGCFVPNNAAGEVTIKCLQRTHLHGTDIQSFAP